MKITFARELSEATPYACCEAVEWVRRKERQGLDDNEIWKLCDRGDWLYWLLLDVFNVGEGAEVFTGSFYYAAVSSLREVLEYPTLFASDAATQAAFADRIHKIFPEWPL